jgi:hypothetical protein
MVFATNTSAQSIPNGAVETVVTGWTEVTDITSSFDPATGIFTAPRAGNYTITTNLSTTTGLAWVLTEFWRVGIQVNGTSVSRLGVNAQTSATFQLQQGHSVTYRLNAGDTVSTSATTNRTGGAVSLLATANANTLSIVELPSNT